MATYPVLGIAPSWRPLVALGIIGFGGMVLAMALAWPQALAASLSALVLQYGISMIGQVHVDPAVMLYTAALVVVAELALAVIAQRPIDSRREALTLRDLGRIGSLAALAALIAGTVVVSTSTPLPDWRWLPAVALGAASSTLAIVVALSRARP